MSKFRIQVKCKERDGDRWHFVRPSYGDPYEYDTYEAADCKIDLIKHENWDRDKYRVFPFDEQAKDEMFFNTFEVPDKCDGCQHLIETRDPFSTGDSPTEYECGIDRRQDCENWSDDSWLTK